MSVDKFEEVVDFEDPITKYDSLGGYLFNIAMLRALFSPVFRLHSVYQSGPRELTTRWTMKMYFRLLPWQPELVFTGLSIYGINPDSGKFRSHKDIWDSVEDNAYFSQEGLRDLVQQCLQIYRTPEALGSPAFEVLVRRAQYEVRQYESFSALQATCAEGPSCVGRAPSSLPAFSQIEKQAGTAVKLGLPYLWAVSRANEAEQVIAQRPIQGPVSPEALERSGGSVCSYPAGAVAAITFAGEASPDKLEAMEALLRSSLAQDGLTPAQANSGGFLAARYYAQTGLTPAPLLRNEVLIPLEGYTLPQE